jgi:hypothetical protein
MLELRVPPRLFPSRLPTLRLWSPWLLPSGVRTLRLCPCEFWWRFRSRHGRGFPRWRRAPLDPPMSDTPPTLTRKLWPQRRWLGGGNQRRGQHGAPGEVFGPKSRPSAWPVTSRLRARKLGSQLTPGGGNRIRPIGRAPAKGSSGRCQSKTAARKAERLTGSGPKRQYLPGVAAHGLSLRGGTASSNPSSSSSQSVSAVNPEAIGEKPRTLAAVCGWRGTREGTRRLRTGTPSPFLSDGH